MRRLWSRIFMICNIVLISVLMLAGIALFFCSNLPTVGPYSFHLADGNPPLLVITAPSDTFSAGDQLLLGMDGQYFLVTLERVDSGILEYTDSLGETRAFPAENESILGKVTFSSRFLGKIFAALATSEHVPLYYLSIGVGLLLTLLLLTLAQLAWTRRSSPIPPAEHPCLDELVWTEDLPSPSCEEEEAPPASETLPLESPSAPEPDTSPTEPESLASEEEFSDIFTEIEREFQDLLK